MPDTSDPEMLRRMDAALMNIPARHRDIFIAHRVHGMSYAEIAQRTGRSIGQVEHIMVRALAKLAKQMNGRKLSWWERRF